MMSQNWVDYNLQFTFKVNFCVCINKYVMTLKQEVWQFHWKSFRVAWGSHICSKSHIHMPELTHILLGLTNRCLKIYLNYIERIYWDFSCDLFPAVPRTSASQCSSVPEPRYGKRIGSDFGLGTVVLFACNPGYILHGASAMRCESVPNSLAQWNGTVPLCTGMCTILYLYFYCWGVWSERCWRGLM